MKIITDSLRIAVDATSLDRGGGLTVGARLWNEISKTYSVDLHIFYSKKIVAEVVRKNKIKCTLHPILRERSSLIRFFIGRLFYLAYEIKLLSPHVVWGTNFMVHNLSEISQVVHQQNLKHFLNDKPLWLRFLGGDSYGATRDIFCRKAVCNATANIYISEFLKENSVPFQVGNGLNHHVVHNPVLENNYQTKRNEASKVERSYLLSVSSVADHKDNPTLFSILAELKEKRLDIKWKLLIAGAGDWRKYDSLLKDLNISSQVEFLGYCDYQELAGLYQSAFCLISTSKVEAFGNAPIEAMAFDCPVIAANSTAMPEVIGDAGYLVNPGDVAAFSDAVLELWDDYKLRNKLIEKGRNRIQVFTIEESAQKIYEILKRYSNA